MAKKELIGFRKTLEIRPRSSIKGTLAPKITVGRKLSCTVSPQLHTEFKFYLMEEGTSIQKKILSMVKAYVMRKSHV